MPVKAGGEDHGVFQNGFFNYVSPNIASNFEHHGAIMKTFIRLVRETRGAHGYLLGATGVLLLLTLATQSVTLMMGRILDALIGASNGNLLNLVLLLLLSTIAVFLLGPLHTFLSAKSNRLVLYHLRKRNVEELSQIEAERIPCHRSGDMAGRLSNDLEQLENGITDFIQNTTRSFFQVGIALVLAISIHWKVALLAFGLPVTYNLLVMLLSKPLERMKKAELAALGEVHALFLDNLRGHLEIKVYGIRSWIESRFKKIASSHFAHSLRFARVWALIPAGDYFMSQGQPVAVVLLGAHYIAAHEMTYGELIVLLRLGRILLNFIWEVDPHALRILSATAQRLFDLWDEPKERLSGTIESLNDNVPLVCFEKVHFAYLSTDPSDQAPQPVLQDIRFRLNRGETLGIVGASGSGKSTLLRLLCGFYPSWQGNIHFGGSALEDWNLHHLRKHVALVEQDTFLFPVSAHANVALGDRSKTFRQYQSGEIDSVLQQVGLWDRTASCPVRGPVWEGGGNLSGGERQRLAIARALFKKADLLLLDEPTSALDNVAARKIKGILLDAVRKTGTTVIAVSHNLEFVKDFDTILVLENGRIVEAGNHQDLMMAAGAYYRLWREQSNAFAEQEAYGA